MKDGPIRTGVKWLALGFFFANLRATRVIWRLQGRRPYRLGGQCRLCAKCCEAPTIQTSAWTFRVPFLRRLFLAWHRRINGFELVEAHSLSQMFVFRCTHFDTATRRCDSYHSRPGMCRDYPRLLLWEPHAPLLPGCGYRAVSRSAGRVAELLEKEDIPPEKLAEVKRQLHAEED